MKINKFWLIYAVVLVVVAIPMFFVLNIHFTDKLAIEAGKLAVEQLENPSTDKLQKVQFYKTGWMYQYIGGILLLTAIVYLLNRVQK